jgi:ATP-dependent DNA helicase RecQ
MIREAFLAKKSNKTIDEVNSILTSLHRLNIARYYPSREGGFIEYIEAIEDPRIILTYNTFYKELRERNNEQVNASLHYAENKKQCRSVQLLSYLGETQSKPCGQCDVCLGLNDPLPSKEQQKVMETAILGLIEKRNVNPSQLRFQLYQFPKEKLLYVLREMIDRGIIQVQKNGLLSLVK